MTAPVIQFKRGLLANLPGLQAGEPGFTTDSYDLYVGLTSNTATNRFVGSHRYWTKGTSTTGSGVNLVEGTNNGTSFITLASPASLAGIVTYYLPGSQGSAGYVLSNDGAGNLSWADPAASASFSGVVNFTDTTDNELGNANSGAVQIDGGLGVNKNLTIGQNLNVQGYSEFVGVVTFRGGTIGLGDTEGDNVVVGGEFASDLIPTTDDTFNLGSSSKQWKDLYLNGTADIDALTVSGVSTFANSVVVGGASTALLVTGNTRIVGILTVGSASVTFSGVNNRIAGVTTFTDPAIFESSIDVDGHTELDDVNISGIVTAGTGNITGNLTVGGNLFVNGSTTQVNTQSLTVEDALIEVGLVNGSAPSTDLDIDLGLLLNYYDGSAKKAAVFWDDSAARIVIASAVSESSGVLTPSGYAGLEIGSLFVNDCAGQSQVISCSGSTRNLINITIDCGTF
jgi:hypothetical protein